ncbi:MAG: LysM peptidoglycan-binding domain-containing protein [Phycisphaerae bacterium]
MAIRFKSGATPKSRDALLWIIVGVLVIWGAWQTIKVRRQVLKALHTRRAPYVQATAAPTATASGRTTPSRPFSVAHRSGQTFGANTAAPLRPAPTIVHVLTPGLLTQVHHQIAQARLALKHGHLLTARHTLQTALRHISGFGEHEADTIRAVLMQINARSVLSSAIVPGDPLVRLVRVQPGDTLDYLAGLYRITPRMILQINPGLQPRSLIAGTSVKVILGPIDAYILIHAARIDVMIRQHFIADFPMRVVIPIAPRLGRYRVKNYLPGPLRLDEWILQAVSDRSRLILAGGDIPDADIRLSPQSITALHRMINTHFSRITIEP